MAITINNAVGSNSGFVKLVFSAAGGSAHDETTLERLYQALPADVKRSRRENGKVAANGASVFEIEIPA